MASSSCGKCDRLDTDDMIACESCSARFHSDCVEESPGATGRKFKCDVCLSKKTRKTTTKKPSKVGDSSANLPPTQSLGAIREVCGNLAVLVDPVIPIPPVMSENYPRTPDCDQATIISQGRHTADLMELDFDQELQKMRDEMERNERKLEQERILREKQLEFKRQYAEKCQKQEKQLQQKQLEMEKSILAKKLADEMEFQQQQRALREDYERARSEMLSVSQEEAIGGYDPIKERDDLSGVEKVKKWLRDDEPKQINDAVNPHSGYKFDRPTYPKPLAEKVQKRIISDEQSSASGIDDYSPRAGVVQSVVDREPQPGPTRAQLAARSALLRNLPTFSGKPEEWPLFISSYKNSTEACGLSNQENLVRLQECLKGPALESVRSRLMLPSSVPKIIHMLREVYGRPEQLIHSLLSKVKRAAAPRVDRLETFIQFGMVVQELCDHLEAAELHDHLVNPTLIQELVEKLPAATKREWVQFKRAEGRTTLRTFADFTSKIMSEASEVTLVVDQKFSDFRLSDRPRSKEKGFLQAHSSGAVGNPFPVPSICRFCRKNNHRIRNCDDFRSCPLKERIRLMTQWKLCERCLNEHDGWCRFKITCNVGSCRQHHHPLVHRDSREPLPARQHSVRSMDDSPAQSPMPMNAHHHTKFPVIFRMAPVTIHNGNHSIKTMAYIDEGSSITLIEDNLARELELKGIPQPLTLQWTANVVRHEALSECVCVEISGDGGDRFQLSDAHTVKKMHLPSQLIDFQQISNQYPHLRGLFAATHTGEEPRILIGLNNVFLFAPLESRVGDPSEPIAVRSHLGWTIYGPRKPQGSSVFVGCHDEMRVTNLDLHDQIRTYFQADDSGFLVKELPESDDLKRARSILNCTTVRVDGRYEVGLLWAKDDIKLPDSFAMALQREKHFERRLKKNPHIEQVVRQQVEAYLSKRYAHKATPEELDSAEPGRIWYLPLNYVENPKKPGKVRLVWDAAAQAHGISLNSVLLPGPDLLTSLPAVIQRFRERKVAFGADLREMYHQIRVREQDRQAQRFLFRSNPNVEPEIYIMDVCTFGSACSPAMAQFVKKLNATQFVDKFPEAVGVIDRRHYVDDYYDCTDTEEQAITRAQQVRYIHQQAGFEFHGWVSNRKSVLQALGAPSTPEVALSDPKTSGTQRVLGIIWKPEEDVFVFSTDVRTDLHPYFYNQIRPTKRIALSGIMSLFDQLGFLAPFTILGKLLLQDLWRTGCEWDQLIDDDSFAKWQQFTSFMPAVGSVKIERCYLQTFSPEAYRTLELHTFVDASEQAYGATSFFRITEGNSYRCSLVMAKTKVSPLKQFSIPRMELCAAVLGSALANKIECEHDLKVTRRVFWSDSRTVLSWIRSDQRKYKPFVGFRIGTILQNTKIDEWRWVPTKHNIADIVTKPSASLFLETDSPWFLGPDFLRKDESEWPEQHLPSPNTTEELRVCHQHHTTISSFSFIDVTRISKWNILLRTICCVFRFASNCRRKAKKEPIETVEAPDSTKRLVVRFVPGVVVPLQQSEYERAETVLWKMAQHQHYFDELATLKKNEGLPKEKWLSIEKTSPLHRLLPFLDDLGVLRVDGRIREATFIPFDTRFPIILPREHAVTYHLINFYHQRYGHANKETVFNEMRQRFHISKLRPVIDRVGKQCQWCAVRKSRPRPARMAPLPVERITPYLKPFSYVGVDYFGPIEVTVGRRSEKRWIVLFTCLSVRAIHLEVAYRLNTDSCIMAIRRFVLRRGPPVTFFSDNGTNLKAASKELQEQIKRIDTASANVFTNARTRWSFNPPSAPHMGGIWERMVRSTKAAMATLTSGSRMTDEILLTVITEAEEIVNTRPLVYLPQDSDEPESLTPNHFLRGSSSGQLDLPIPPTGEAAALRSSYCRSQLLSDELWKRWLKEYLPSLNVRSKWIESNEPLKKDDLVFVTDDLSRNSWIRGQIVDVIPGKDNQVRQVLVRTSSGVFRRPVTKLAVIEVGSSSKSDSEAGSGQVLRAGEC
ncbi:uncharacterized protein LOC129737973 [Uranotaenia lowii]|uniref:uncharacterized protein LOC129737973 n=1 Tax=Uranotaenia lowii TaxID=190385 RepID=UPI0024793703|nr:uncharacterized protein LOC129737973 [Uranotaenia lowii]